MVDVFNQFIYDDFFLDLRKGLALFFKTKKEVQKRQNLSTRTFLFGGFRSVGNIKNDASDVFSNKAGAQVAQVGSTRKIE